MKDIVDHAIQEDVGNGDITTNAIVPRSKMAVAVIVAKENGIIAGLDQASEVFKRIDRALKFTKKVKNGTAVKRGRVIAKVKGRAASILTGERTALNYLQRLSGIATLTGNFVKKVKGTKTRILDTRKTTPGLRIEEKAAVKAGGGANHRIGLFDAVLIKDNHIAIAGGVKQALDKVRSAHFIEIEADNLDQVKEALSAGCSRILLDNMNIKTMKKAVSLVKIRNKTHRKKVETEASGGIGIDKVRSIAKTGVNYISIGALTHSAEALDISLDIEHVS